MLFNNCIFYRLTAPMIAAEPLSERLAANPFAPCGSQDLERQGWVPVVEGEEPMVIAAGDAMLICLRKQQKILPGAAIAEALDAKVAEIEAQQGRKVYRKERRELKEEVTISLLPRALTRSSRLYALILNDLLVVNTASRARAEELLTQLRKDIGTLAVEPLETAAVPEVVFTGWLADNTIPATFALGEQCDLRDASEFSNIVRVRGQELRSDEVLQHLEAGKQAVKVELHQRDRLSFVLDGGLVVRRLRFDDSLLDAAHGEEESALARAEADVALMAGALTQLLDELLPAFGGIAA